jgi:hypothetical protein
MADDWKPGDLALCVRSGIIRRHRLSRKVVSRGVGLKAGAIYSVESVVQRDRDGDLVLFLHEIDHSDGWGRLASRFRKINPLTDEERDEFIRELNVRKLTPYEAELAEMREVGL